MNAGGKTGKLAVKPADGYGVDSLGERSGCGHIGGGPALEMTLSAGFAAQLCLRSSGRGPLIERVAAPLFIAGLLPRIISVRCKRTRSQVTLS